MQGIGLSEKCGLSDEISALAVYVVFSAMDITKIHRKNPVLLERKTFILIKKEKWEISHFIYGVVNAVELSLVLLLSPSTCAPDVPLAVTIYIVVPGAQLL